MLAIVGGSFSLPSSASSPSRDKSQHHPLPSGAWMKMQRRTELDWQMSLKSVMLPDMARTIIVPGAGASGPALNRLMGRIVRQNI